MKEQAKTIGGLEAKVAYFHSDIFKCCKISLTGY